MIGLHLPVRQLGQQKFAGSKQPLPLHPKQSLPARQFKKDARSLKVQALSGEHGAAAVQLLQDISMTQQDVFTYTYLSIALVIVGGGSFFVFRSIYLYQQLGIRIRNIVKTIKDGEASAEDYFELGLMLNQKKLYTQANKNFEKSVQLWDGDTKELAPVYNAMGYAYSHMDKKKTALRNYTRAVELQPKYTVAWCNLGRMYEDEYDFLKSARAYKKALKSAPDNNVALEGFKRSQYRARNMGMMD